MEIHEALGLQFTGTNLFVSFGLHGLSLAQREAGSQVPASPL